MSAAPILLKASFEKAYPCGVAMSALRKSAFDTTLSIARSLASTPEPV